MTATAAFLSEVVTGGLYLSLALLDRVRIAGSSKIFASQPTTVGRFTGSGETRVH
jgi:hypothetical protein